MALAVLIFSESFGNIMMVEKWIGGVFFLGFSSLNFQRTGSLIGTWKEEQNVCIQFHQTGFHCC